MLFSSCLCVRGAIIELVGDSVHLNLHGIFSSSVIAAGCRLQTRFRAACHLVYVKFLC